MSPHNQARAIFLAVRGDATAIKIQRDAYKALAASITSPNGGMQIIRSQVNGQEFDARHSSTPQERFNVLSILMTMLTRDSHGTKSTLGRFA